MKTPKWLTSVIVTAIYEEAIYEFGGLGGVRDIGLVESALDRPRNQLAYEPKTDLFELAATLCVGVAANRCRGHCLIQNLRRMTYGEPS